MNTSIFCGMGLLGVVGLWSAGSAAADVAMIHFAENVQGDTPSGESCSVEIKEGDFIYPNLMDGTIPRRLCPDDKLSYFRLENVPSTTVIGLAAEGDCRGIVSPEKDNYDWYYKVHVYINGLQSNWMGISELRNAVPGQIFKRGVMVDEGKYLKGSMEKKLSCLSIQLSEEATEEDK